MKSRTQIATFLLNLTLLFILNSCAEHNNLPAPSQLTIGEGLEDPLGFYDDNPSFSWKLPVGIQRQSAYSIVVASSPDLLPGKADIWESGEVASDQTIFVNYGGEPLSSKQQVFWKVRYWDEEGTASEWSETATFELGLLSNDEWQAKWIHIPVDQLTEIDGRGSLLFRPQYFRKELTVGKKLKKARLYITAKGVYEAYINGKKVGDDIMPPGWTPYDKSFSTLTYDVTDLVQKGQNTIGVIVAEGWYAGRINLRATKKTTAHTPQLLMQLEIEDADGHHVIASDKTWKVVNNGPIRTSKIWDGETYDANHELGSWNEHGYDDKDWLEAEEQLLEDSILLLPKRFQGVQSKQELKVVEITQPEENKAVFDFGQNNVGVPHLRVPMKKGDTLTVRFSEMLNPDGTLYTDNYRSALSTNHYIAAKDGEVDWIPSFTFHGYRYVELSGYSQENRPSKDWIAAIVQYTDFNWNGTFSSSHKKLNQLQSNITWGLRGNFFDIPTDCPQRDERYGWTGDAQVIAPTAIFNADMYAFWAGWLQSMRQEQFPNGGIPYVVPNCLGDRSSAGWGDASVIIPWELYFRTGDKRVLEENYNMMKGWLELYASRAQNHIVKMPHYFGDWLQPYSELDNNNQEKRRGDTPSDFISTAYFARCVNLTMKSASVLGKDEEAEQLQLLHDSIKEAFEKEFFDVNGRTTSKFETQTQYLLALEYGLLSDATAPKVLQQLLRVIKECDNHLRTGFLGTPILPLVLDRVGEIDLMYEILFKETYPSWFYSINQGATTMWERWDSYTHENGFNPQGMNSFNHYAYGAIGQWMYERIAGIKPVKAGYKEIEIAPVPGGPLTSAEASYNCPYGLVSSSWKIENNAFHLEVDIPPNTTAKVIVPGDTGDELLVNGKAYSRDTNLQKEENLERAFVLNVPPGNYRFETRIK